MLKSQKPSGSVHVVILVILIIALVGILGLIFWHKYSNQKTETSVTSGALNSANVDPYKDWNTYESINTKYSIKYPKDWIALKETVQDGPYIRNFDPTSKQPQGGYPDGYINVRILRDENNADFRAMTGYTTTEWYDTLGKVQVRNGPITHSPEDVKELKINGLPAKSTKAAFTETDEIIYVLRGDKLYSINLYPYGISSDPTVKLMLDSFTFTY
jgi:hypothetical protein